MASLENSGEKMLPPTEPLPTNELTDSLRLRVSNPAIHGNVDSFLEQQNQSLPASGDSGPSVSVTNSVPTAALIEEILRTNDRHVFIVSESGKPVYSRCGTLEQLVTLVGVMQTLHEFVKSSSSSHHPENPALLSVARAHIPRASSTNSLPAGGGTSSSNLSTSPGHGLGHSGQEGSSLQSVADSREALRTVRTSDRLIIFLPREPLLFIAVGRADEDAAMLANLLDLLYCQVLTALHRKKLHALLSEHSNFDLRRILSSNDRLLDRLVDAYDTDPAVVLEGYRLLPLDPGVRETVAQWLVDAANAHKPKDLVFAVLLADSTVVAIATIRQYALDLRDLLLLVNFVSGSRASFRAGESWVPLCLPRFEPDGMLFGHLSHLDESSSRVCLVLLSAAYDQSSFTQLSACRASLLEKLSSTRYSSLLSGSASSSTSAANKQLGARTVLEHLVHLLDTPDESSYSTVDLFDASSPTAPDVWHFIYRHTATGQLMYPLVDAPLLVSPTPPAQPSSNSYLEAERLKPLLREYKRLVRWLRSPTQPQRCVLRRTSEALFFAMVIYNKTRISNSSFQVERFTCKLYCMRMDILNVLRTLYS